MTPPEQIGPQLEAELARQIEYLAADAFGPAAVPRFLAELRTACAEDRGGTWLAAQNYVLWHLVRILGAEAVPGFLDDFLDPSRWEGLRPDCL